MLDKTELETIASLFEGLNYYQILKVSPVASEAEIREAFHREALELHPDQYFSDADPQLQELSKKVYAKIVEAYQCLSKREKRLEYDRKIQGKASPNLNALEEIEDDIDEDAVTSIRRKPTWATGGPGEKFFQLAQKAFSTRDYKTASMNIQIALGADPENPKYLVLKERVNVELEKIKKKKESKD